MKRGLTSLALVVALASRAVAQQSTGIAAVDSATAARAAWARASAALRANDLPKAHAELTRAAAAWPTQPTYLWGHAVIAARTADTAGALAALHAYAMLGLGRDVPAEPLFAPLLGARGFGDVIARHDSNRAPLARSTVRVQLPDSTFWPEGVDYASGARKFYVASVRHRTIAEVSERGATRELWTRDQPGIGAMLGVRADETRGVI